MAIRVSNLHPDITREDLWENFAEFGTVREVVLTVDPESGLPSGSAIVEMISRTEEISAIEVLDGSELRGQVIKVWPA